MELSAEQKMIEGLWPHPKQDTDNDGNVTAKEKIFYILKMIPWTIIQIFVPLLAANVKKGVADLLPLAGSIAADLALSALTGEQKAVNFNDQMLAAAKAKGVELAAADLNWLRENAVQMIKNEVANPQ